MTTLSAVKLCWLGQSYHATGRYAEARECYEQIINSALVSESEKASVQEGIGKLYYEEGDYKKTIATFETIVTRFLRMTRFTAMSCFVGSFL